jgi:NADH-quinone oxidoreductase subunit J
MSDGKKHWIEAMPRASNMTLFVFFIYGMLLLPVILMVLCVNPIHSVIFFILISFSASVVFTLLHVDFIGLIFLMVYVGAIAVLFLLVVMMLNIRRIERDNTTYLLIGGFIPLLFFLQLVYIVLGSYTSYSPSNVLPNLSLSFHMLTNNDEFTTRYLVQLLGILIFTKYPVVLVLSGITLLVSMVGAIYLTNTKLGYSARRQDNQVYRTNTLFNIHTY